MAEGSLLGTSKAPASHSYKAFSLSSGDAGLQNTTYNGQNETNSSTYRPTYEGYSSNNATNTSTTVSDFARRMAAVSDTCMNTSSYAFSKPNSNYIYQSIDDICSQARKLIGKDHYQTSDYELDSKAKAIMSKYISTSDSSRFGINCDLDYSPKKYSSPSFITTTYSNRYTPGDNQYSNYTENDTDAPGDNQYSNYRENDTVSLAEENTKSKSSFNSGSNIQITSSASTRRNSNQPHRQESRSSAKSSKRSSNHRKQLNLSPSKTNMANEPRKSGSSKSRTDESPNNNNVIRFTRIYPNNDQQGIDNGYNSNQTRMKKKMRHDATNNSCQCHKPKVPCPVHDAAQTSMSHGQFSGTNEGAPSVECSCGGTVQEPSNVEQPVEESVPEEQPSEPKQTKSKKKVHAKKKAGSRHYMINEAKRVYKENEMLKAEGMYLRNELECTRKGLIMECAKVLHSVLTFCDEKAQKNKRICHDNVKTTAANCSCSRMV